MKITKNQLKRIIKEWRQNPAKIRLERRKRDRQRMIDQMTFEQLKRRAFDSALDIQGRLDTGQYEYADIWEAEIPMLADYVDAAKIKAAEEGVAYDDVPEVRHNGGVVDLSEYSLGLPPEIKESKIKITKSELRQIIKEEKARLMREMHPRAVADNAYMDALEGADELMAAIKQGARLGVDKGAEEDELYIMTGGAEGLTVKVLRRGR